MFIYVCGVSGSGKSTLTREVADRTNAIPLGGGSNIMEFHNIEDSEYFQEGVVPCYDKWFIPYERYHHLKDQEDPATWRLLDMHFHYFRMNGDRPRPVQWYDPVNLKCVILLEAPVDVVLERRHKDRESRPDRSFDRYCIRAEQNIERTGARAFCCQHRISLLSLPNIDLESSIKTVIAQMA